MSNIIFNLPLYSLYCTSIIICIYIYYHLYVYIYAELAPKVAATAFEAELIGAVVKRSRSHRFKSRLVTFFPTGPG